jgi:site-specific DNA-methyltransferase (adenine-specific)
MEKTFGKHPTQKPIDLLQRIVLASTDRNDLILDPFAGSSTTGLAAYYYDRKYVGIDTDEQYLELSKKRFENLASIMKRREVYDQASSEEQSASKVQEPRDMYELYLDNGDKSRERTTRRKQRKQ